MTQDLVFAKDTNNEKWVAKVTATGEKMVIQVDRNEAAMMIGYANLDGLRPVTVFRVGPNERKDVIFEVDAPAGVVVTLESFYEPVAAKVMIGE